VSVESRLNAALAGIPLSGEHPCPYLDGLVARDQAFYWSPGQGKMSGTFYQDLMDQHFRRSGRVFYRPRCPECSACTPLRIDVRDFAPSASQRRVRRRNADVTVRWATPSLDQAKLDLYRRYVVHRHGRDEPDPDSVREFLYDSPTDTLEATYWLGERLVGVGICDVTPVALSTVYFYFDPEESRRSLGVYSALVEIETAKRLDLGYYYLGFWVPGSPKMDYKARLGRHQLLGIGGWTWA
jgi:arginine-tRNA-protein transferase